MKERQAPLWVYGSGTLALTVSAPEQMRAQIWVDGQVRENVSVSGSTALTTALEGERWHAVVLEVPQLLDTRPPRGLRLSSLVLR